jgi:hypothetical protein
MSSSDTLREMAGRFPGTAVARELRSAATAIDERDRLLDAMQQFLVYEDLRGLFEARLDQELIDLYHEHFDLDDERDRFEEAQDMFSGGEEGEE